MIREYVAPVLFASAIFALPGQAAAQTHDHVSPGQQVLGEVDFATSCTPAAHKLFNQGMLYQHSFWYSAARKAFDEALKTDPQCAIAYWGIAMSLRLNPFAPLAPKNVPEARTALQKAKVIGAKTERERDMIDALAVFYGDDDKVPQPARNRAYAKAMEAVAQRHPNDDEVQMQYALALVVATPPTDKTYVNQLKAAGILEPIFKRKPQHPGVAHYLIHTYDYPAIAHKGLEAAKRYAEIAGSAPHALHMPSHIFTRVGYWKESIASNSASARVAREHKELSDQLHASDYLVYAYLQLAQDSTARDVLNEMMAITGFPPVALGAVFAQAASPARYAVERGDWTGAAALEVRPSRFPFADAITHFARALGAARTGNPAAAKAEIAKLAELRDKLRTAKNDYWAEQVDIQWQVVAAWALYADGKHSEALKALAAAPDAEDKTDKHPVTPGPLAPARELLGEMLLERGNAKDALAAFEATLKKEPNRLRTIVGAARAAAKAGDAAKARQYYAQVVALAAEGDASRVEVAEARAYVAN